MTRGTRRILVTIWLQKTYLESSCYAHPDEGSEVPLLEWSSGSDVVAGVVGKSSF